MSHGYIAKLPKVIPKKIIVNKHHEMKSFVLESKHLMTYSEAKFLHSKSRLDKNE